MYKILLLIFLLSVAGLTSYAQHSATVVEGGEVQQMMEKFIHKNKNNQYLRAWRVQIISTDDRRIMESEREKFTKLFPEMKTEWRHVSPFFQVRAGAFRNKMQLMPFLMDLREIFPLATAVQEDIKIQEFLSNK
jgi:hypothetical protein